MVTKKVSVQRKWLEPVPEVNGQRIPKSEWPKKRRYCWIVRWYGTTGKRHGKLFDKKKEAERYARKVQVLIEYGKQDEPEKICIHDFTLEHKVLRKGHVAHATLVDQMRALNFFETFLGPKKLLSQITPRDAEAFITERLRLERSIGTVNKDIRTLKAIFNLAIEPRGYLREGRNPFAKIKERKESAKAIRYVNVKEYRALINASKNLWWKALFSIAYCSGLRRGEILNLTWADIDFHHERIHIVAKKHGLLTIRWEPKDHQSRVVPMSDETAQILADLQVDAPEGFPYIFISRKRFQRIEDLIEAGKWNDRKAIINNLTRDFEVIRHHSGVNKCTLHDLRRSAITNWAQELPVQVVQELAGHSNIATTRKYYLAVRAEDVERANEVVNHILNRATSD